MPEYENRRQPRFHQPVRKDLATGCTGPWGSSAGLRIALRSKENHLTFHIPDSIMEQAFLDSFGIELLAPSINRIRGHLASIELQKGVE